MAVQRSEPELLGSCTILGAPELLLPTAPVRRRSLAPKAVLIAVDLVALALAMLGAAHLRGLAPGAPPVLHQPDHLILAAVAQPLAVAVFVRYRLYSSRHVSSRLFEFGRLVHAVAVASIGAVVVAYLLDLRISRGLVLLTALFALVLLTVVRDLVRRWFVAARRTGKYLRDVLIVGGNPEAQNLARMLCDAPGHGYRVRGFVCDHPVESELPTIGPPDEILDLVQVAGVDGVIVASSAMGDADVTRLTRALHVAGIHVELTSGLRDVAPQRLTVRGLGPFPVVYLEPSRPTWSQAAAKRTFDVLGAVVGLIVAAPLFVLTAIAIKVDSRGPVLFRQERVGKEGRRFSVYKLRTMAVGAEDRRHEVEALNEADGPLFKIRDDPRVTRVGRVLRRYSIDELPQLVNILTNDMSLVGPRPALADETAGWDAADYQRLLVKPGLTGMWQVSGRSDTSFDEYVRLDLYYVHNWSLATDVAIVAKTIPAVLRARGAC